MIEQQRDVVLALAQRRDVHVVGAQPEVEVLSETARIALFGEVVMCCDDDARPELFGHVAPQRVVLPLLQQPEQLHLAGERQVPDLVQKQGPVGGLLDHAVAALVGTGKGPLLVPEQGIGEDAVLQPGDVHRDQRTLPPAEGMDRAGDQFLADPALAGDQDRLSAFGHRLDVLEDGAHRLVAGDDGGEGLRALQAVVEEPAPHLLVFQLQFLHPDGASHRVYDAVLLVRFHQVVEGPKPHAAYGRLDLVQPGQDDDRHLRMLLGDASQQFLPRQVRHGEIEKYQADPAPGQNSHDLPAVAERHDVADRPRSLKRHAEAAQPRRLVVHQKDAKSGIECFVHRHSSLKTLTLP